MQPEWTEAPLTRSGGGHFGVATRHLLPLLRISWSFALQRQNKCPDRHGDPPPSHNRQPPEFIELLIWHGVCEDMAQWPVLTSCPKIPPCANDTSATSPSLPCCIKSCKLGCKRSSPWRAKRTSDRCRATCIRNLRSTCAVESWLGALRVRTAEAAGLRCSWPSHVNFAVYARRAERDARAKPR